jgi:hypothetical protein
MQDNKSKIKLILLKKLLASIKKKYKIKLVT